jgi:hypothetical protein
MNQTADLPTKRSKLTDSLMARVARIVGESDGKYELIEKLGTELGLSGASLVWVCGKTGRLDGKQYGRWQCWQQDGSFHKISEYGCGNQILLPSKIA